MHSFLWNISSWVKGETAKPVGTIAVPAASRTAAGGDNPDFKQMFYASLKLQSNQSDLRAEAASVRRTESGAANNGKPLNEADTPPEPQGEETAENSEALLEQQRPIRIAAAPDQDLINIERGASGREDKMPPIIATKDEPGTGPQDETPGVLQKSASSDQFREQTKIAQPIAPAQRLLADQQPSSGPSPIVGATLTAGPRQLPQEHKVPVVHQNHTRLDKTTPQKVSTIEQALTGQMRTTDKAFRQDATAEKAGLWGQDPRTGGKARPSNDVPGSRRDNVTADQPKRSGPFRSEALDDQKPLQAMASVEAGQRVGQAAGTLPLARSELHKKSAPVEASRSVAVPRSSKRADAGGHGSRPINGRNAEDLVEAPKTPNFGSLSFERPVSSGSAPVVENMISHSPNTKLAHLDARESQPPVAPFLKSTSIRLAVDPIKTLDQTPPVFTSAKIETLQAPTVLPDSRMESASVKSVSYPKASVIQLEAANEIPVQGPKGKAEQSVGDNHATAKSVLPLSGFELHTDQIEATPIARSFSRDRKDHISDRLAHVGQAPIMRLANDGPSRPVASFSTQDPSAVISASGSADSLIDKIRTTGMDGNGFARLESGTAPATLPLHTAPRHDLPVHIARQLADTFQNTGHKKVEIALNPEELGRVRLALSSTETGMVMQVTADRPETLELMRRHIADLAQEFKAIGYPDISFSFAGSDAEQKGTAEPEKPILAEDRPDTPVEDILEIALSTAPVSGVDIRL